MYTRARLPGGQTLSDLLRMLLTLTVPEEEAGMRLDRWLASRLVDLDLPGVQRAIADGRIRVAGEPCTDPGHRLDPDTQVGYEPSEEEAPTRKIVNEELPLDVIAQDDYLVALAKPSGVHVVGARAHDIGQALAHRFGSAAPRGQPRAPGILGSPDPDASGVMLLARSHKVHEAMIRGIEAGALECLSLAIVHGTGLAETGTFEDPIGPHPTRRRHYTGRSARGREALTEYTVWSRYKGLSLVQLKTTTWRPHQLRVHLSEAGHPIAGDLLYGGRPLADLRRLALHGAAVGFLHPGRGKPVMFEAPLPRDMATAIQRLFPNAGDD